MGCPRDARALFPGVRHKPFKSDYRSAVCGMQHNHKEKWCLWSGALLNQCPPLLTGCGIQAVYISSWFPSWQMLYSHETACKLLENLMTWGTKEMNLSWSWIYVPLQCSLWHKCRAGCLRWGWPLGRAVIASLPGCWLKHTPHKALLTNWAHLWAEDHSGTVLSSASGAAWCPVFSPFCKPFIESG